MKLIERVRSFWAQPDVRSTMILTLVVWVCALPLIFLVATPFLGWRVAGLAALGLLVLLLPICWGICWFRVAKRP